MHATQQRKKRNSSFQNKKKKKGIDNPLSMHHRKLDWFAKSILPVCACVSHVVFSREKEETECLFLIKRFVVVLMLRIDKCYETL